MSSGIGVRLGWLAAQAGHRVGALALLAACAGVGLMLAGKRPFVPILVCACAAAALGLLSSLLARRLGERDRGLVIFNGVVFFLTILAMIVGRSGWWNIVGVLARAVRP